MKIISGIYKITNKITKEFYIGSSTNIYCRWQSHKNRAFNKSSKEYNKKLYKSIRKYGVENFNFEILEEVLNNDDLKSIENKYIKELNAYNLGFNENIKNENHGKSKLTNNDIIEIRQRYNNLESKRNVYDDFKEKINLTGFHKIWNGYTWKEILPEVYTEENKKFHKYNTGSPGEKNSRTKLTNEDVKYIRSKKSKGFSKKEIFKEFSNKITYGSFGNLWYGYNWKHI